MKPKEKGRARRKANATARGQRKFTRAIERAIKLGGTVAVPASEGAEPEHSWVPAELVRVSLLYPEAIRTTKPVAEAVMAITAPDTFTPVERLEMLDGVTELYRVSAWHEARERALNDLYRLGYQWHVSYQPESQEP